MSWGEFPTAYKMVKRTARKKHRCCECRGAIQPGEQYNYHSGVWEGEPASFKVCIDCDVLRDQVRLDCDLLPEEIPALGCLADDLEFSHLDDFRAIQIKRNSNSRNFLAWQAEQPAADQKGGK